MAYARQHGAGAYSKIQDWTWLYYPPPYRFASKAQGPKGPYYPQYASAQYMGLGCTDCGGGCKGTGDGSLQIDPPAIDFDFSLQSTSLADKVQSLLPISSHFQIPNWVLYAGAGLLLLRGSRGR
jgi:hypothetical protein